MNNLMKLKYASLIIACCASVTMQAQTIDEVLSQIERNNKELQAQTQATLAAKLEVKTQNSLEDPSVEYSPFYTKGITGMSSSELVVTQGFDFPTLYAARRQSGKWQQTTLDHRQSAVRRDILLTAKNLCLDLIMLNQQQELLNERKKNADEMLALFEKRMQEGDAGILEVNKIKMERMGIETEVAQNNAAHRTALQQLLAMNGNLPLEFSSNTYPKVPELNDYNSLYDEVMAADADLMAADANAQAARKAVKVNRQSWLPKTDRRKPAHFLQPEERTNRARAGNQCPASAGQHTHPDRSPHTEPVQRDETAPRSDEGVRHHADAQDTPSAV